jgi:phosphonate metabolism-associated iron-containing alcohol dehydrogenase
MSLARSGLEFEEILERRIARGKRIDTLAHVPVVAVPTTAGTGSEVTPWAAMWDMGNQNKYSVQGHSLWPEAAIIDPHLAASCPVEVTRNCGLDALSHALEAIWNRNHNPVSDALAVSAARGILEGLPRVLAAAGPEAEQEARTTLSLSALKAGLAFSNTETALCHAISYDLTMKGQVKHGLACSFSLPRVLSLAYGHDAGRDALIREVFRGFDGEKKEQPWEILDGFLRRVGVSTDLKDYGIEGEEDFTQRAREGMKARRGRNFLLAGGGEMGGRGWR